MEGRLPDDLRRVWRQRQIPVVVRRGLGFPLYVKLPAPRGHDETFYRFFEWLRSIRPNGRMPKWLSKYAGWEIPRAWFNDLVNGALKRHGQLYVIQPHKEQEVCAPACMNAEGHECECQCMGANHGAGGPGAAWFVVSDAFATRWTGGSLACRLMKLRK